MTTYFYIITLSISVEGGGLLQATTTGELHLADGTRRASALQRAVQDGLEGANLPPDVPHSVSFFSLEKAVL